VGIQGECPASAFAAFPHAPCRTQHIKRIWFQVSDRSLTTRLLDPFWNWLASFIPASVAPNVITLAGFICQLLAFWVSDPSVVQWIGDKTSAISAAVFTYSYMTLDALDGKHARNTKQSGALQPPLLPSSCTPRQCQVLNMICTVGPLGEIFDHACDNIGGAFSAIAFMRILASFEGIESFAHPAVMWYGVQAYGMAFLLCHLFAFDHPERKIVFKVGKRSGRSRLCVPAPCGQFTTTYISISPIRACKCMVNAPFFSP